MSSSATVPSKSRVIIEFDPKLEEMNKEAAKKLKREKMKAIVDEAMPLAKEAARASVDASIITGSIAATAAATAYAPVALPFVGACIAETVKEKETLYKASDASVQKTAPLIKDSIDSCC